MSAGCTAVSNCTLLLVADGSIAHCGISGSHQSAATFKDCKVLLVMTLTHVGSTAANSQTFALL